MKALSARQYEIAKEMATNHLQQKELAARFACSVRTMRWYSETVKQHFGVSDRLQLIVFWSTRRRALATYDRYKIWLQKQS